MTIDVAAILSRLERPGAKAADLLPVYQTTDYAAAWSAGPSLHRAFARKLIGQGHPAKAFELAREGLVPHPADQELRYLVALAMARGGNVPGAQDQLDGLLSGPDLEPPLRVEAVSLQGRLYKDLFVRTSDPPRKREYAAQAASYYRQAAELPGADSYPRINAATLSLLAGSAKQAKGLARQVIKQAQRELKLPGRAEDYWVLATVGEAYFLLGDIAEATQWYSRAVTAARAQHALGDIAAMRRNALLLKGRHQISDELLRLFYVGSVVVFAGHMIDHPQRSAREGAPPRFPPDPQLVQEVSAAIQGELDKLNATIGVCSVACGSDILFAEHVLARGAELHAVLPYDRTDFYATSVDFGLPGREWKQWRRRCDAVLERATDVHFATQERYLGDEFLVEFNSAFMQGFAILRAAQRGVEPFALTVYDRASQNRAGGTGYFLEQWAKKNLRSTSIDLRGLRQRVLGPDSSQPPVVARPAALKSGDHMERELKSMLFADVKNFSTLTDPFLPRFFFRFLGAVHDVLGFLPNPPVAANTWGDGLYLVFNRVGDCAEAALRLLERSETMGWEELGLGKGSPLRIGIHTGPVFRGMDPITERMNYFGSQVTRAARIEPVTMPGCAFASEQFAALLTVESAGKYACEYIGVEQLAKQYDRCVLFRLARGGDED